MNVTDVVRTVFAKLTSTLIMIMITDFNDDGASLCIIITIKDDHNSFAAQSRARSKLAPSHARGLHWIPGGGGSGGGGGGGGYQVVGHHQLHRCRSRCDFHWRSQCGFNRMRSPGVLIDPTLAQPSLLAS